MALTGTELLRTAPYRPATGCESGIYIVTLGIRSFTVNPGAVGQGVLVVMNTTTQEVRTYGTGVPGNRNFYGSVRLPNGRVCITSDGAGLVGTPRPVVVDPATGANYTYTVPVDTNEALEVNGFVVVNMSNSGLRWFDPANDTVTTTSSIGTAKSAWASFQDHLFIANNARIRQYVVGSTSSGNAIMVNEWVFPFAGVYGSPGGPGWVIGSSIYWVVTGGWMRFTPGTGEVALVGITPTGRPGTIGRTAQLNGLLYTFASGPNSGQIVVDNPATGEWKMEPHPGAYVDTSWSVQLYAAAGKIWAPSSLPLTWPD
jgi:hypothetical protein